MKTLISCVIRGAVCLGSVVIAQESAFEVHPLVTSYEQALGEKRAELDQEMDALQSQYIGHLQSLARAAQNRGDLESLIVIKAEEKALAEKGELPEGDPPPPLAEARQVYHGRVEALRKHHEQQALRVHRTFVDVATSTVQELTADGKDDQVGPLAKRIQAADALIASIAPPPPPPTPTPKPERLGKNILHGGSVDDAAERRWYVSNPGGRNKTGFYQEPNSGMNQTFRFEQHESRWIGVSRHIRLKPGATYRVTWRARLLRPWRDGIELRGKGRYQMGFRIPARIFNAMPPLEQEKYRMSIRFSRQPPPDREWRDYRATLTAYPLQEIFFISVSAGEGEMLIDDIRIREILPPEKEKPDAEN